MEDNKTIEDYKKELDKTNKLINTKTTNLIYLLKNCNIEDINILNYHYTFIKLVGTDIRIQKKLRGGIS